jgi:hypothetical protein
MVISLIKATRGSAASPLDIGLAFICVLDRPFARAQHFSLVASEAETRNGLPIPAFEDHAAFARWLAAEPRASKGRN